LLHRCCNIPRLSLYIHLLLLGRPGTYTSSTSPRIDSQLWWPDPITIPICRQCLWWWLRNQSRRKYPSMWRRDTIHETIHSNNITILPLSFFPSLIDVRRRISSHNRRWHFCLLWLWLYWYLPLSKMHHGLVRQGRPRTRHSRSRSCRPNRCSVCRGSRSSTRCACTGFRGSTTLRSRRGRPSG